MAASSSAIRMLPVGMALSCLRDGRRLADGLVVAAVYRHQHAEHGASRRGLAFNDPAVIADDLRHQREAEPASRRLGGDEGIEKVRHQIVRNPGAVVLDAELERQRHARLAAWRGQTYARAKGGSEVDLAVACALPD